MIAFSGWKSLGSFCASANDLKNPQEPQGTTPLCDRNHHCRFLLNDSSGGRLLTVAAPCELPVGRETADAQPHQINQADRQAVAPAQQV
jgi:hypothetical protein